MPAGEWLLLIHQIPPAPAYLRVKVRRRLHRLGAVALKNTVYVLPATDAHLEDLQWLASEIIGDGGDAAICVARFISGPSDAELARTRAGGDKAAAAPSGAASARPRGAIWVTRKDVFVDRMASAWLIKRFIDPAARFRFVEQARARRGSREIRFDMYGGEYTHAGDRCTFETLIEAFGMSDDRLTPIAQIVHDIDLKDGKFGRPETPGIAAVLQGIKSGTPRDAQRLERAALVFDGLYERLGSGR